jgi:biopolymer transport protein ExbB/TolQ
MTKPAKIAFRIGLALLGLGLLVTAGGTVWGMVRAFYQVNAVGMTPPDQLGSSIALTLVCGPIGISIMFFGGLTIAITLIVNSATKSNSRPSNS